MAVAKRIALAILYGSFIGVLSIIGIACTLEVATIIVLMVNGIPEVEVEAIIMSNAYRIPSSILISLIGVKIGWNVFKKKSMSYMDKFEKARKSPGQKAFSKWSLK